MWWRVTFPLRAIKVNKAHRGLKAILGLRVYRENLDRRVNRVHKDLRVKQVKLAP